MLRKGKRRIIKQDILISMIKDKGILWKVLLNGSQPTEKITRPLSLGYYPLVPHTCVESLQFYGTY